MFQPQNNYYTWQKNVDNRARSSEDTMYTISTNTIMEENRTEEARKILRASLFVETFNQKRKRIGQSYLKSVS